MNMIRITDILDKVTENHPDAEVDIIDRAYLPVIRGKPDARRKKLLERNQRQVKANLFLFT